MSNLKPLTHFAASVLLFSSLSLFSAAKAQIEVRPLLDLDCVDIDGKPSNDFEEFDRGVSIGKQFYWSVMRAYPGAGITCQLPNEENPSLLPLSLVLEFGLHDVSVGNSPIQIIAYVDGKSMEPTTVRPGELQKIAIPLNNNASSIALEIQCDNPATCNSWLYFIKAELQNGEDMELQDGEDIELQDGKEIEL